MTGYKNIKFNGIDRLYADYSWRLNSRAKSVWKSGDVLQGQYLSKLEKAIAKKYKRKYAVGVGSATDGLYFAMQALGIKNTDTVVCPALSYIATAGAIKRLGANIQFVDTDAKGNIGEWGSIGLPSAVVYVNLYGNLADYTRLRAYCDRHKIPLIEDAAQSQGAMHGNIPSGKLGDVSVFSFDPMKNMPSFGSGGMVLTDDVRVFKNIMSIRRHGTLGGHEYGYNSLIPEDHAHQLLLILDKFDRLQKMRTKVFNMYKKELAGLELIECSDGNTPSHHKLVLLSKNRNGLQEYLARAGIETKIHYKDVLDKSERYPNAEFICARALSLPIYPHLKKEEVLYVCNKIKEFQNV